MVTRDDPVESRTRKAHPTARLTRRGRIRGRIRGRSAALRGRIRGRIHGRSAALRGAVDALARLARGRDLFAPPRALGDALARLARGRDLFERGNESPVRRDGLAQRGQTLVEFALVIPIFMVLLMATIEFGLAFNALLDVDYASRNATLLAAEAGNSSGADCVILQSIEQDINPPASSTAIQTVEIYWAEADGTMHSTGGIANENVYTRGGGTTSCTYPDGSTISVPYSATSINYVDTSRCSALKGCGSAHPELDTIGVRITYKHTWRTPAAAFLGQTGSGFTIVDSNAMRMEPIL